MPLFAHQASLINDTIDALDFELPAIDLTPYLLVETSQRQAHRHSILSALDHVDAHIHELEAIIARIEDVRQTCKQRRAVMNDALSPSAPFPMN